MKNFRQFDPAKSVDEREKEVQKFWEENDIFRKSLDGENGERLKRNTYTFFDGPPFATGLPHYGHIAGTVIKDAVPRYWTMRGFRLERKWGWDCHGLPIENIVEKELGSKNKKDIEKMGVAEFNETCRSKVLEYAAEWEKIIPRIGRWADMKNAYRTMDRDYMESVWWAFAELYRKGLVYESYRAMHICPRCETTLSQSEVSEGYADIKDLSATVKFKLKPESLRQLSASAAQLSANTYVLAWTTTPWTLPGNVALAVGENIEYTVVRIDREYFVCAKDLVEKVFAGREYEEIAQLKGTDLIGLEYEPIYDFAQKGDLKNKENGWKIYEADFVTTESGTGIVHIAPAFGEDDMNLGHKKNLPFVQHVGMDGIVNEEVGKPLAGKDVKPRAKGKPTEVREIDIEVVRDLAERKLLFAKEKYEHSYPHCWRCDTALLNYATSSWFVAVTKIKDELLRNAEKINWSPSHIKEGRFGKWLEGARDWSISRQRFWASVIPIWVCDRCETKKVFGSVSELEEAGGREVKDLHKHIVDEITFDCNKCRQGVMKRVPDVLDTWFDSGAMPYAQKHYPFENKEEFEKGFPADFIAEGVDQTRCWFYYLHVLAGGLRGTHAFNNVIVNGTVLAEDGKKMSKRLKNYPDPMEVVAKYGADVLRFYLLSSPLVRAEDLNFSEKGLAELSRGMFRMLRQSFGFFTMYAEVDGWRPREVFRRPPRVDHVLDRWIISRLFELIAEVEKEMEAYDLQKAVRAFAPFVDDLSNWYIRRSRSRFWKSEDDEDKNNAYATVYFVLVELAKTLAPFAPFVAEEIYRTLTADVPGARESVHLEDFPQVDTSEIDTEIIARMTMTREIVTKGLELRACEGIKVRQPLDRLLLTQKVDDEFAQIIKEELNVKELEFVDVETFDVGESEVSWSEDKSVGLDIKITPELRQEGQAREIIRHIQSARKKADFNVDDRIVLGYEGMEEVFAVENLRDLIAREVLAVEVVRGQIENPDFVQNIEIDGEELKIHLRRN